MKVKKIQPVAKPTESEAIVAAQRPPVNPPALLPPPVPLPVDLAAGLHSPPAKGGVKGAGL